MAQELQQNNFAIGLRCKFEYNILLAEKIYGVKTRMEAEIQTNNKKKLVLLLYIVQLYSKINIGNKHTSKG